MLDLSEPSVQDAGNEPNDRYALINALTSTGSPNGVPVP